MMHIMFLRYCRSAGRAQLRPRASSRSGRDIQRLKVDSLKGQKEATAPVSKKGFCGCVCTRKSYAMPFNEPAIN